MTEDGAIDYDLVAETYAEEQTLPDTNLKKYMVVRIQLNPDAKWSDGEPVTVEDVYFSFDLCANNQLSNHAGALTWVSDLKHKYQDGSSSPWECLPTTIIPTVIPLPKRRRTGSCICM